MTAVIFDLDGVISNTNDLHARIESDLLGRYGIPLKPHQITAAYAGVSDREFFGHMFALFRREADLETVIEEKWSRLLEAAPGRIAPIEGAPQLIRTLYDAGAQMAVASASRRPFIEGVLRELGLDYAFSALVCAEDVPFGKPHPAIYLHAATLLGAQPAECTGIEDGEAGMLALRAAGMRCIALVSDETRAYPADKVVTRLADLRLADFALGGG